MRINNAVIVGLGSIGRRHAQILKKLSPGCRIFACRTKMGSLVDTPQGIIEIDLNTFAENQYDIAIIANPSSMHHETLKKVILASNTKLIFVEKPFCLPEEIHDSAKLLGNNKKINVIPGNSLRFHPAIDILKGLIKRNDLGSVIEAYAHFGTYMPGWHPWEDHKKSYAAKKEYGGGALLTSIHEMDLFYHLFGNGVVIASFIGNNVLTEINVEDSAQMLIQFSKCKIANISLNFYEKPSDRYVKVVFMNGFFNWNFKDDFITFSKNGKESRRDVSHDANSMYINMWKRILNDDFIDFEMTSVYNSLKAIKIMGEKKNGSRIKK
jgi:predicted dehydrogenase